MTTIAESGLIFGPYPDEHCFHIEKSATYLRVQERLHMAEFLLLRPRSNQLSQVWVVEAKSSSPRKEDQTRFAEYIEEIRQKLTNGLMLGIAARLKRHQAADAEMSTNFKDLDLASVEFRLILVIKNHQREWLPDLQNALSRALYATARTWAMGAMAVIVLNEAGARKHRLIR